MGSNHKECPAHLLPASLGMGGWESDVKCARPDEKLGPKLSGPSETLSNIHVTTILGNQNITGKLIVLNVFARLWDPETSPAHVRSESRFALLFAT